MQKMIRLTSLASCAVLAGALTACAPQPTTPYPAAAYPDSRPTYPHNTVGMEYGRVANIETLQGNTQGRTTGAGAVIGAVIGGVLGNQVGKGNGRAAATAVGAVGGAVAGNAIEGRNQSGQDEAYRLSIQLDQGGYRYYDVNSPGDLRIGDRVRLYNGQISRM